MKNHQSFNESDTGPKTRRSKPAPSGPEPDGAPVPACRKPPEEGLSFADWLWNKPLRLQL